MGQTESADVRSAPPSRWPAADDSGGAGFFPLAMARRLLVAGSAAPALDDTQFHSDSEEFGPVMHEAVNWLATRSSRDANGKDWRGVRVSTSEACELDGAEVCAKDGAVVDAVNPAIAAMSRGQESRVAWRRGVELRALVGEPGGAAGRHRRRSVPTAVWYAPLEEGDRQDQQQEAPGPTGASRWPGAARREGHGRSWRLSEQLPDGVVPQWLHQLSTWVHLTPSANRSAAGPLPPRPRSKPKGQLLIFRPVLAPFWSPG